MKIKNIISALLALVIAFSMAACNTTGDGEGSSTPESTPSDFESKIPEYDFMSEDLSKYITLGQYKGLEIEIDPIYVVTEDDVKAQIIIDLVNSKMYDEVKDRAVTKFDVINMSFEGFVDGVAFEGGKGDEDMFTVYTGGGFIPGFSDGVIGAMPGEEIDVSVTFPEDYREESLAGKPAVFKVTVNHIYEAKELTDEVAQKLSGKEDMTAEALRADYMQKMTESNQTTYDEYKLTLVWKTIFEKSATVIALPEDLVDAYYQQDVDYYKMHATYYGMSYEDFLEKEVGTTDEEIYEGAYERVKNEILVYAIIKAENVTISEDEYNEMLDEWVNDTEYTKEDILESYTKEELIDIFTMSKLYDLGVSWQTYIDKAE